MLIAARPLVRLMGRSVIRPIMWSVPMMVLTTMYLGIPVVVTVPVRVTMTLVRSVGPVVSVWPVMVRPVACMNSGINFNIVTRVSFSLHRVSVTMPVIAYQVMRQL